MSRAGELWTRFRRRLGRIGADSDSDRGEGATDALPRPARVIVGLGNPGAKYQDTRHNIGFRIVERLASQAGMGWRDDPGLLARVAFGEMAGLPCLLVEPQTFMNRSGQSVEALCERWPELDPGRDLIVVYDDLDLPTGRIRLRSAGGAGGHRGIADILEALATRDVPRLRFGVGHPGAREAVLDWVLSAFPEEEEVRVAAGLDRAVEAIEVALAEGVPAASGRFNGSA